MKIQFEIFRSAFKAWDTLFSQAAEFANSLQPDRFITICHSEDHNEGVVVVWYWG